MMMKKSEGQSVVASRMAQMFGEPLGYVNGANFYQLELDNTITHDDPRGLNAQTNGPTTQPDTQGGLEVTGGVNLIVWAADKSDPNDPDVGKTYQDVQQYVASHKGTDFTTATNSNELLNAINAAYKKNGNKPVNVVIFGHGNNVQGPGFGDNPNWSAMFFGWEQAWEDLRKQKCSDKSKQSIFDNFNTDDLDFLNALKGKLNNLILGGCMLGKDSMSQAIVQALSDKLGIDITVFKGIDAEGYNPNNKGLSFDPPQGKAGGNNFIYPVTPTH